MTDQRYDFGASGVKRSGGRLQRFGFPPGDDQTGASVGQTFGNGQPDAPAGAGHQGAPAGQIEEVGHETSDRGDWGLSFAPEDLSVCAHWMLPNATSGERETINLQGAQRKR